MPHTRTAVCAWTATSYATSRGASLQRAANVRQLLASSYKSGASGREQLLKGLGETVVGKGEREPVEDVPGASERNRRVVLLFPPAQVGNVTSICEAAQSQR